MDANGFAVKPLDRGLEDLLHREPVGLALPTDQPGAVIFDNQLVTGHGSFVPGGMG